MRWLAAAVRPEARIRAASPQSPVSRPAGLG